MLQYGGLLTRKRGPFAIMSTTVYALNLRQPITWSWGTAKPTPNEYSWTNLSSVLWVEQPIGTGFSQGEPNIKVRLFMLFSNLRFTHIRT